MIVVEQDFGRRRRWWTLQEEEAAFTRESVTNEESAGGGVGSRRAGICPVVHTTLTVHRVHPVASSMYVVYPVFVLVCV